MSQQALVIRDGLPFGGGVLGEDGQQVLLPVVTEIEWKAAPKRGKNKCPTINLTVALPSDACPATDDVSWMQFYRPDGQGGKLKDIKVILVFEPDTLSMTEGN